MSFSVVNGYTPRSYENILDECINVVNEQFNTSYTRETFVGTNMWKFLYAGIQQIMVAENSTAQLVDKIKDYIRTQNEELIKPTSSPDGFMERMEEELGLISSIKPTEESDAGYVYMAVDVDTSDESYPQVKQSIFNLMAKYLGVGLFYEGGESGTVTARNGQAFNYAYDLPSKTNLKVKIVITVSDNTLSYIETPSIIKEKFLNNFNKKYRLGYNFEPQIYLNSNDLPFASDIKITYSTDGGSSYKNTVLKAMYDEKIIVTEDNIEVEVI